MFRHGPELYLVELRRILVLFVFGVVLPDRAAGVVQLLKQAEQVALRRVQLLLKPAFFRLIMLFFALYALVDQLLVNLVEDLVLGLRLVRAFLLLLVIGV